MADRRIRSISGYGKKIDLDMKNPDQESAKFQKKMCNGMNAFVVMVVAKLGLDVFGHDEISATLSIPPYTNTFDMRSSIKNLHFKKSNNIQGHHCVQNRKQSNISVLLTAAVAAKEKRNAKGLYD